MGLSVRKPILIVSIQFTNDILLNTLCFSHRGNGNSETNSNKCNGSNRI